MKLFILALIIIACYARTYPMYKQCDSRWGNERLGTSSRTICQAGCLMSSAAMALSGLGHNYNPSTLNTWLTHNGGYVSGDAYVWGAIDKLGVTYRGRIPNTEIKKHLDQGNVVILNVHNGGHWVLAHGYNGDKILVNDPGFSTSEYSLSQIVNGNTGVYSVNKVPQFLHDILISVQKCVNDLTGYSDPVTHEGDIQSVENLQEIKIA